MRSKKNNIASKNNKLSFAISLILAIALVICAFLLILGEVNNHKQNDITNYGNQQMQLVNQIVLNATDILKSEQQNKEQILIDKVIKNAETNGSRFWMFGTQDEILFYKNEEETQKLSSTNFLELAKDFSIQGGTNSKELYTRLQHKQSGSFTYSKSQNSKTYLMSLQFIEANNQTYVIALSTAKDYILSTLKLTPHTVYILLYASMVLVAVLILVLVYSLVIVNYKNRITGFEKQLKDKNVMIESLSKKVEGSQMKKQDCSIYDPLTGVLYNKTFLDAFLKRSPNARLFPLGIVIFRIGSEGYCEDSVLLRTANIIRQNIRKTDILARDGADFILVALKQTDNEIANMMDQITNEYNHYIKQYEMQTVYCVKKDVDYRLHKLLELAYEELDLQVKQSKEDVYEIQSI